MQLCRIASLEGEAQRCVVVAGLAEELQATRVIDVPCYGTAVQREVCSRCVDVAEEVIHRRYVNSFPVRGYYESSSLHLHIIVHLVDVYVCAALVNLGIPNGAIDINKKIRTSVHLQIQVNVIDSPHPKPRARGTDLAVENIAIGPSFEQ